MRGILIWVTLSLSAVGWATQTVPPAQPSLEEFRQFCRQFRAGHEDIALELHPLNETHYQDTRALHAGQSRFSYDRQNELLQKAIEKEGLKIENGVWKLPHDGQKSLLTRRAPLLVIHYRGKGFIRNGHHKVLNNTYLGGKTVPVKIVADWNHKPPEQFFADMKEAGYTYYAGAGGSPGLPVELCELMNDPFLMLARKAIAKVEFTVDDEFNVNISSVPKEDKRVVAFKLNSDVPFIEFHIADALHKAGFVWKPGDELTTQILNRILRILKRSDNPHLKPVLLLDNVKSVAKLDVKGLIQEHVRQIHCEHQLLSGDSD